MIHHGRRGVEGGCRGLLLLGGLRMEAQWSVDLLFVEVC